MCAVKGQVTCQTQGNAHTSKYREHVISVGHRGNLPRIKYMPLSPCWVIFQCPVFQYPEALPAACRVLPYTAEVPAAPQAPTPQMKEPVVRGHLITYATLFVE